MIDSGFASTTSGSAAATDNQLSPPGSSGIIEHNEHISGRAAVIDLGVDTATLARDSSLEKLSVDGECPSPENTRMDSNLEVQWSKFIDDRASDLSTSGAADILLSTHFQVPNKPHDQKSQAAVTLNGADKPLLIDAKYRGIRRRKYKDRPDFHTVYSNLPSTNTSSTYYPEKYGAGSLAHPASSSHSNHDNPTWRQTNIKTNNNSESLNNGRKTEIDCTMIP